MYPKTEIQQLCTESCCVDGDGDRKVKCSKCKRSVHFICTNLPMYQLRLFHTKNYQGFICVNCIEVPDEFGEMLKNQGESMSDTYKREIKSVQEYHHGAKRQ